MHEKKKIDKVLLLDFDDVITGGTIGKRKISQAVLERIKELQRKGFHACIITGRSPFSLDQIQLGKTLEKHNLHESVLVYAEHGALRYYRNAETGHWESKPIGQAKIYMQTERKQLLEYLNKTIKKLGGEFILVPTKVSFCFTTRGLYKPKPEELARAVKKAVRLVNFLGEFSTKIKMIKTTAGCDVVPVHSTKRAAAREFLSYFSNPRGFAFGDSFHDREMALNSGIKFILVRSPQEFLSKSVLLERKLAKRKALAKRLKKRRRFKAKTKKLVHGITRKLRH